MINDLGMQGNFFEENYRAGGDSGSGSLVSSTVTYRHVIESFIRLNDVHSVLDLGCGDWERCSGSSRLALLFYGLLVLGPGDRPGSPGQRLSCVRC